MKTMKLLRRFTAAAAALILAVVMCAVPAHATVTPDNNADTGELEFQITASATAVKIRGTVDVTLTLLNNTIYPLTDFSCRFNYDSKRFGIYNYEKSSDACTLNSNNSQSYIDIDFTASDNDTRAAIPSAGGKAEIKLTLVVLDTNTDPQECVFTVSDAKGLQRTDVKNTSTAASNLAHEFTFKKYPEQKINITGLSNNADLTSIVPYVNNAEVDISPEFSSDVLNYTVTVSFSIPSFKFTWTKSDSNANVSYQPPEGNTLEVGDNTFKFVVTAEDGKTTKTYTAIVRRLKEGETKPPTSATSSTTTTTTTTKTVSASDVTTTVSTTTSTESTETTTTTDYGFGGETLPSFPEDPTDESDLDKGISLTLGTLLALVGFQLLLFALAYLSGYISHKNAAKSSTPTLNDIIEASQLITVLAQQANMLPQQQLPPEEPVLTLPPDSLQPVEEAPAEDTLDYYDVPIQNAGTGYGDYGQFYTTEFMLPADQFAAQQQQQQQSAYPDPQIQEFNPDEQYDEYGYNAAGESNYRGEEPPANTTFYQQ